MTSIVVVGDSHAGKTTFAHVACSHKVPLNVYRSTGTETFFVRGLDTCTTLKVLPGEVSDHTLQDECHGADGVIIVYDHPNAIYHAKRWLVRLNRLLTGLGAVPVMICKHKVPYGCTRHDRRLSNLLAMYHLAEHTCTSIDRPIGIIDGINRIITRIRRAPPSPLCRRSAEICNV